MALESAAVASLDLKKIPLFAGLKDDQLRALVERTVPRSFPKNAIVVNEGDLTDSLYLIISGKVKVYLGDESGKELILDIKGPGQYFGEMVLDDRARSATVMTVEAAQFATLSRADVVAAAPQHAVIG